MVIKAIFIFTVVIVLARAYNYEKKRMKKKAGKEGDKPSRSVR